MVICEDHVSLDRLVGELLESIDYTLLIDLCLVVDIAIFNFFDKINEPG